MYRHQDHVIAHVPVGFYPMLGSQVTRQTFQYHVKMDGT
jgi:hypothetical protein